MRIPKLFLASGLLLWAGLATAQVEIKGTVYDETQQYAMRGVSVISTSGKGTMTDSLGHYRIVVPLTDSLSFSYLGKSTSKFAVREIPAGSPFDMSIAVAIDTLPAAQIWSPNYTLDSLENRKEYAKVFDYEKSYLTNMKSGRRGGMGVGLDLDMLIDGKAGRRMEALRDRLVWEEQEKYIDHRWNRAIVRRITGLQPPALDTFMRQYRPSYDLIRGCSTEYEFYQYIAEWGKFFDEDWKNAHKDSVIIGKPGDH